MQKIDTLFLDVGGVLMTNGWDHNARARASVEFDFDLDTFEMRHKEVYNDHEKGYISLDDYLEHVLFYKPRKFTLEKIREFMFAQSQPDPKMIDLFVDVKKKYPVKICIVSNEGRDLAEHRIEVGDMHSFVDAYFFSSFVHAQKPDPTIYHFALDVTQKLPEQVLYIDDRQELVVAAKELGIHTMRHTSYNSTKQAIEAMVV